LAVFQMAAVATATVAKAIATVRFLVRVGFDGAA
jgi:hypothetical protein